MISSRYVKHPASHSMVITHEILPEIYSYLFDQKYSPRHFNSNICYFLGVRLLQLCDPSRVN